MSSPGHDHDRHVGSETPIWHRIHLLWRLHFGMPATVGLAVLTMSLPLVFSAWDELQDVRATHRPLPLRTSLGQPLAGMDPPRADVTAVLPGAVQVGSPSQRAEAMLLEVLPQSQQRGADLGYLIATARGIGLSVVQFDYGMVASRLTGLALLRVELSLRGTDAELQQLLVKAYEQFPNLAVESVQWLPTGNAAGRANMALRVVQYYRAPPAATDEQASTPLK
ncbi:MAG: hypothetical protein RIQ60_82 [Pseudomonadota bacterium]|jgi:hypothetical protein